MTTDMQPMGNRFIVGSKEMGLPRIPLKNVNHVRAQSMMDNFGNSFDIQGASASKQQNFINN
jgi:hypothetical protein